MICGALDSRSTIKSPIGRHRVEAGLGSRERPTGGGQITIAEPQYRVLIAVRDTAVVGGRVDSFIIVVMLCQFQSGSAVDRESVVDARAATRKGTPENFQR